MQIVRYIPYQLGQVKMDMKTFLLQSSASNATEDSGVNFRYSVYVDVVTFQLIQSKAKLVV